LGHQPKKRQTLGSGSIGRRRSPVRTGAPATNHQDIGLDHINHAEFLCALSPDDVINLDGQGCWRELPTYP
jgi:hypothetical protein